MSEDYARLRALAMLRVDEVSLSSPGPSATSSPHEERDRLRDEFLSSPEGKEFASDSDEAWAASLAIDFCADYVDGRPLRGVRWSSSCSWPTGFRARCSPTKVCSNGSRRRWTHGSGLRVASRHAGMGDQSNREAIPRWREQMVERGNDPAAAGQPSSSSPPRRRPGSTSRTRRRWALSWLAGTRAARLPDATPRGDLAYCRWVLTLFSRSCRRARTDSSHSHTRPHLRSFSLGFSRLLCCLGP